jgi:hypothetical protein
LAIASDQHEIAAGETRFGVVGDGCELHLCVPAGAVAVVVERTARLVVDDVVVGIGRCGAGKEILRFQGY